MSIRPYLFISVFISFTSFSQITFEHAYPGDVRRIRLENSGEKYYSFDAPNLTLQLFNADHTPWRSIILPADTVGKFVTIYSVTETFFNPDSQVEVLFTEGTNVNVTFTTKLVNENGQLLLNAHGLYSDANIEPGPNLKVLILAAGTNVYAMPQATIDHVYTPFAQLWDIEGVGKKYVVSDFSSKTILIYNLDHSPYKTIPIALPSNVTSWSVKHLSKSKIKADQQIEGIVASGNTNMFVFDESGQILLTGVSFANVTEIPGWPDKLTIGHEVYGLPGLIHEYTYFPFPFRINLETSGPKYIAGFNDSINLYNQDHTPYWKQKISHSPGYSISDYNDFSQTTFDSDTLVEIACISSTGPSNEGRILNQNNMVLLTVPKCDRFFISKIGGGSQNKLLARIVADSSSFVMETRVYGLPSYDIAGLTETMANHKILVFPNPSSRTLYLESPGSLIKEVEIYDVDGHEMARTVFDKPCEINIETLPEGLYILKIFLEDGSVHLHKQVVHK